MLTLRENKKFEMTSSGFFMVWYEAGTWVIKQDSIKLSFVDHQQHITKTESIYLDRQKSVLVFQDTDSTGLRLRVVFNKLSD